MIANSFSGMCKALAPALGNHLWQSTLFAIAAGLLTLILRNNYARTRYLLWLTASVKFLIPFSCLSSLGSHIAWWHGSAGANSGLYIAMDQLSQPFSQSRISLISETTPAIRSASLLDLLPALLAAVWLCGIAVAVLAWYMRWRRISSVMREAVPQREGREAETLRRLEHAAGMSQQIEMRVSRTSLEPGVLGISHPILLLPTGITDRLTDGQLEGIITHELCHVRRRDNLAAVLHMFVEAVFWFHPLVWWIGARLIDERERACDEKVLSLGGDPQVYAEGILKVCEFYLESPLFCAAGVTGSNLTKRIEAIMVHRVPSNLGLGKKLFLSTMASLALVGPIVFGFFDATQSRADSKPQSTPSAVVAFAEATIKPNENDTPMAGFNIKGKPFSAVLSKPDRFMATNFTLRKLLRIAYGVQDPQLVGGPDWINSEKFDVDAKVDASLVEQLAKLSQQEAGLERGHMLQALLTDRFKLSLHREIRDLPTFALVVADGGPKFNLAKPGETYSNGPKGPGGRPVGTGYFEPEKGKLINQGQPIGALVSDLSGRLGQMVVDKTGLTGDFDFTLQWTVDPSKNADTDASAFLTAVQDQLGLKLERQSTPTEVLVIDHAEPISNSTSSQLRP